MEIFRAKANVILSCTSKFTSWAYVEVSSSLSNAFAVTWGLPHNATLQANLVIFCLFCGWRRTLTEYSDKTHPYASYKTSLFFDAFRLTVIDFFGEFCELMLNTCIKKPYYGYNGGQWPYRLGRTYKQKQAKFWKK